MSNQYQFGFYENAMKGQLRDYETHSDISCKIGYSDSESEGVASIKDVPYYAYNHNLNNSKNEKLEKPLWKSIYDIEETTKNSFSDYEYKKNENSDSEVESPRFGNTSAEDEEDEEDQEDDRIGKIGEATLMRKANQMDDAEEDEWGKGQTKAANHPQNLYPLMKRDGQIREVPFRKPFGNFFNEGTHIANHLSYNFRKEFENNMYSNLSAFKSAQNKISVDHGDDASRHFLKPKTFKDSNGLFYDFGEEKLDIGFLIKEHEKLIKGRGSAKGANSANAKRARNAAKTVTAGERPNDYPTPGQSLHNPDAAKQKSKQNVTKLKKKHTHQYAVNSADKNSSLSSGNSTSDTYEQDFVGKRNVHFKSDEMGKEDDAQWRSPAGEEEDAEEEEEEESEEVQNTDEVDNEMDQVDNEMDQASDEKEEVSDDMDNGTDYGTDDNTHDNLANQVHTADPPTWKQKREHANARGEKNTWKKLTDEGNDPQEKKTGSTPKRSGDMDHDISGAERKTKPLKGGADEDRLNEHIAKQMNFEWWKVNEKMSSPNDIAKSQEGSENRGRILNRYEIPKDISYYVEIYQKRKEGNNADLRDESKNQRQEGMEESTEEASIDGKTSTSGHISKEDFKVEEMHHKNIEKVSSSSFLSEQMGRVHNAGDSDETGEPTGEVPQNGDVFTQGSSSVYPPSDGIKTVMHNGQMEAGVFEIFNQKKDPYCNQSSTKGNDVPTGVGIAGRGSPCEYFFYDKTEERNLLHTSPEDSLDKKNYSVDGTSPPMDEIYDKINAHFGRSTNSKNYMQIMAEDIQSGNKNIRTNLEESKGSQNGPFLELERKEKIDIFLNYLKCIDGHSLNKAFQYFVEKENDDSVRKQLEMCLMGKEREGTANKGTVSEAQGSTLLVTNQNTQTVRASLKNEQVQTNSKGGNMEDNFMQTDIKDVNTKLYVKNEMINKKTSVDSIFFRSLSRDGKSTPKSGAYNGEEVAQFEGKQAKWEKKDPPHDAHNLVDDNINRDEYNDLKKINELKEKILEKIKTCYDNMSENNDEAAAILMLQDRKEHNPLGSSKGMNKSSNGYTERGNNSSAKGKKKKRSKGILTMETFESMKSFEKEMNLLKSHNERLRRRIEKLYAEKERLKSDYLKMEKIKESQDSLFLATEKHIEKLHDQLDDLSRRNQNMKGDLKKKSIQIIALESQIDLDDAPGKNNRGDNPIEEFEQQTVCTTRGDMTKNKEHFLDLNRQLENSKGQIKDKKIIKEQINQLQDQLHTLKDDIKMIESLKMENEKLKKLLSRKNSNLNEYEKNINKLEKNIGMLNDRNFDLRRENTNLCADVMALSRCDEATIDPLDAAQKGTRSGGEEAQNGQAITDRENKIKDLEAHVDTLKQQIFDLKEEIFDLKEKNVQLKKSAMVRSSGDIRTVQTEAEKIYVDKINLLKGKLEESKTKINMLNGLLKTSNSQTTQLNKKVRTILRENKAWQKKYEKCLTYLESLKVKYDEEVLKIQRRKSPLVLGALKEASKSPLRSGESWLKGASGQDALNADGSIQQNGLKSLEGEIYPTEVAPREEEKKGEIQLVNSADTNGSSPGRMDSHIRVSLSNKYEEKEDENEGKFYKISKLNGAESYRKIFFPFGEQSNASFNLVHNENKDVRINDIFEIDNITRDIHRMFSDNEESMNGKGGNRFYSTESGRQHYAEKVKKAEDNGPTEGALKSIEKMYVANRIKQMNEDIHKYIVQRKEKVDYLHDGNLVHQENAQNKGNTQGDRLEGHTKLALKGKDDFNDVTQVDYSTTDQMYYPYGMPQLAQKNVRDDTISFSDTHVVSSTEESYALNNHLRSGNEKNICQRGGFTEASDHLVLKNEKNLRSVFRYKINGEEEDVQIGNSIGRDHPQSQHGTASRISTTQQSGIKELSHSKCGRQLVDDIYTKADENKLLTLGRDNTLLYENESTNNHLNALRYNPYEHKNVSGGTTSDGSRWDIPREDRMNDPNGNDVPTSEPNGKDANAKKKKSEAWIIDLKNNEVFPYRKLENTLLTDEETDVNSEGGPKSGQNKAPRNGPAGPKGAKKKEKAAKHTQREEKKYGGNNRMRKNTNVRTFPPDEKCTKGQFAKKAKSKEKLHLLVNNISKLVKNKIKEELKNNNISKDILNFEITKIKKKANGSKDSLNNKRQDTTIILSSDSMSLSSETLNGTFETEDGCQKSGKWQNGNAASSTSGQGTHMHASTNSAGSSMDINLGRVDMKSTREMCEARRTNAPDSTNASRQTNHKQSASELFAHEKNSPLVGKEAYLYDDVLSTNFMLNDISLNNATCFDPNFIGIEQTLPSELALANMEGEALHLNKLPSSYLDNMNLYHHADRNKTFHLGHNSYMEVKQSISGNHGAFACKPLDCNHANAEKKINMNHVPINGDLNMRMGMIPNGLESQIAAHAQYGVNNRVENVNTRWDVNTISGDYQGMESALVGSMYSPAHNYTNGDNTMFQVEKLNSSYLFDINSLRPEANPPFYDHAFLNYNQLDRSGVTAGNHECTLDSNVGIPNFCNEGKSTVGANPNGLQDGDPNSKHLPPNNCNKAVSNSQAQRGDEPCEGNDTNDTKDRNEANDTKNTNESGKIKEHLPENQKGGLKNARRSKSVDVKKVGVRNRLTNDTLSEKPKMKTQILNYSGNKKNGLRDMSTYADKVLEDMKSLIPSNVSSIVEKSPKGGKGSGSVNELVATKCKSNGETNQRKNLNMGDEYKVGILGKENDKLKCHPGGGIIKGSSANTNLGGTTRTSDLSYTSQDTLPSFRTKERERENSLGKYNMEDNGHMRGINKSNDAQRNDYFLEGVNNEDVLLGKHYSRDTAKKKNIISLEEKNSDEHAKLNAHLGSNMGDITFADIGDVPLNAFGLDNMLKGMHLNNYPNKGSNVLGNALIPSASFAENGLMYKNGREETHQFQSETRKSLSSFREALKKQGILG
ncbi:hypothetical protein C922_02379 [Plasmodium inui San Antonio 1]|uniref:Uncharacterized protein n=1 Tax=Plasmodium inui San Antonio 1 TaxID=1237626 RepID=W7ADT4_9APIC|nr:hypothetical protein C922_02379 [Plasmodium inui San Antonio 1]EUD67229.1 hypothetical protein C922_02379 [Plasmodium inui San Antonio 1]